jgi:hypothetical protein
MYRAHSLERQMVEIVQMQFCFLLLKAFVYPYQQAFLKSRIKRERELSTTKTCSLIKTPYSEYLKNAWL